MSVEFDPGSMSYEVDLKCCILVKISTSKKMSSWSVYEADRSYWIERQGWIQCNLLSHMTGYVVV